MPTDIRNTGYQNYRDLQAQNAEAYTQGGPEIGDWYKSFKQRGIENYGNQPTEYVGLQAANAGYGESKYDDGLVSASQLNDLQDIRYQNQPWYSTLANGTVKMLGTAGTTFLSSLIGLPVGIGTAVAEGRWSGLWDNDVTQALGDTDEWLEENFKNYKSTAQEENKWWQNLGTMNFWADDVIKNVGFTVGAAASMAVGAGAVGLLGKSLGLVNNVSKAGKMANNVVAALFSATGEGMMEARQGVEERNKLETQKLQDALAPEREALDMEMEMADQEYSQTGDYALYQARMEDILSRKKELDDKYAAGQQQIEESGREMGNKILLGNQVLLTAGNLIQFGKAMTKSFDRARHAAETTTKTAKPFGVRAVAKGAAKEGYEVKGKNLGRLIAGTKGIVTEGSEEMNQQWIQSSAGAAYNEKDVNDYWRAKLDPESYRETTRDLYSLGATINQGFNESWKDPDQWEQFVVGAFTGMAGSYSPTKLFNQDKTKSRLDPRRYGSWEGGAYNEVKDFNRQYKQYAENIDDLNKVLEDENFFSRVQNLVARTYSETKKQEALDNDDKKTWKDEDDKQTIHDIQSFLRAGKLDDLRAIYDNMSQEMSDKDIESVVKSTTRTIKNEDGTTSYSGAFVDEDNNKIFTNDKIREELKHNSKELQRKLDSYLDSVEEVNRRTNGQLSKDQEDNLVYLHNLGKESINRADKIMKDVRQSLPQKFLLKTNKSPEQLSQENASSDLAFTKEDNTPEGYVEVDTSMLNDHAFTDFFVKDVLWGGNIRPEFGETADERAIREEEEKNLSEEEKKKRRTAQWKKAYENAQKDAKEQNQTNADLMVENFLNNYRKDNRATEAETFAALGTMLENVGDAVSLVAQAGQFEKTLNEYMAHPEKVDQDKAKEEKKAEKKSREENLKNKFAGKTAKDINQDIADGKMTVEDADDFAFVDLSDVTDEDAKASLQEAQQEAKKSKDIRQKQAEVKAAIVNAADENGWNTATVDDAISAIDSMAANAESADDINLDNVPLAPPPVEGEEKGAFVDMSDLEERAQAAQDIIAFGLNSWKESQDKKDDIPDPSTAESFTNNSEDTGHDSTTQMPGKTATPQVNTPKNDNEWEQPAPVNSASQGAINKVAEELSGREGGTSQNAPWRSTTRRYGRQQVSANKWKVANVPYHELISDKNSILYKRSKAIWEYLDSDLVRAWDHVDNVESGKIEEGDTIHFMVKDFTQQIFGEGTNFEDLTEKQKPQALVILMLNDEGNVLGDLPLAQFERGYHEDSSLIQSPQLRDLKSTQEKLFKAFEEKRKETGCVEAVADKGLNKEGAENLSLTFKTSKRPFVSKISQILNGVAPFTTEINTMNDIIGDNNVMLGISVTGETIATSKDKKDRSASSAKPLRTCNIGQSYILLKSPSGALTPVPFYTKPFDATAHADTQLYKILGEALSNLINNAGKSDTSIYKESIDVLEGLLQVRAQEGAKSTVEIKKDTVTLHLQSLTDANQKIDITVPQTGNTSDMVASMLKELSGTKINISLQYLNSKIGVKNGTSAEYNKVIGQIADANLPKNAYHTVNNAFLIKLTTETSTKKTEVKYPKSGTRVETIGDKTVKVDYDSFRAYAIDPVTKEETEIEGDEEVNLFLAEAKAEQEGRDSNFNIELDGKVRTYNPKEKKFVRTSQGAGVNAGQASINQQKEERKKAKENPVGNPTGTVTIEQKEEAETKSQPAEKPEVPIMEYWDTLDTLGSTDIPKALREAGYSEEEVQEAINQKVGKRAETESQPAVKGEKTSEPIEVLLAWARGEMPYAEAVRLLKGTEYVKTIPGKREIPLIGQKATKDTDYLTPAREIALGKYLTDTYPFLTTEWVKQATTMSTVGGDANLYIVKDAEGNEHGTPSNFIRSLATKPDGRAAEVVKKGVKTATQQQSTERKAKTIEEIEKEVGEARIINSRNKDAWDAIPDTLKLKMVNEGTSIVLEYGGNEVSLDYRNFDDLKSKLKDANKYAKSGSMTAKEGAKYRRAKSEREKKADIKREREWLQKNLPMFSSEDRLHLIQGLIEIPGEKNWAWGRFEKGIITLSDMAARGTLYHEAFHAVTQTLLSDEQLDELYKAGVKHYNEVDEALIEELLAEDFRRYVQRGETPIIGPILKFFRKIMNAVRNLTGYRAPIQQLFYQINNGKFSESIPRKTRTGNAFYQRVRTDRLQPESNPMAQKIRANFNRMNWKSTGKTKKEVRRDMQRLGKQWTRFKEAWMREDGYVPVGEWSYNAFGEDKPGYVFYGVRTLQDEVISLRESRSKAAKTLTAAKQAVKGIDAFSRWYNLNQEEKDALTRFKLNQYRWNNMSVEERQQWQKCHSA